MLLDQSWIEQPTNGSVHTRCKKSLGRSALPVLGLISHRDSAYHLPRPFNNSFTSLQQPGVRLVLATWSIRLSLNDKILQRNLAWVNDIPPLPIKW
jgi:hypothetical protein